MIFGKTTRTPEARCPRCDHKIDAATHDGGEAPEVGDLTVCLYCGNMMKFGDRFSLTTLTDEEVAALDEGTRTKLAVMSSIARTIRS